MIIHKMKPKVETKADSRHTIPKSRNLFCFFRYYVVDLTLNLLYAVF